MQPLVDIHDVSFSYGAVRALAGVSLRLESGTVGIVGNNGAGKSTLLRILLGLLKPTTGHGTVLGCDVRSGGAELRGLVGYMPEAHAVVPLLKGVEFVALSGDLYGMARRDARRRAHEVLGYVGLGELRYRRLDEYSTGNLQRLKLAAALVHDPQLLLLDEPTNGLDPAGRTAMLRTIEDLIAQTGKSVILCTHLLGDIERICRQVVVMHQGTVAQAGSLEALKQRTSSRFLVSWRGPREAFAAALQQAGVTLDSDDAHLAADAKAGGADHLAHVVVPPQWSTVRFFELAAHSEAVVVQLRPEQEDLEQLFFRVTQSGERPASAGRYVAQASSVTPDEALAHGN
ncbi:MAG: ABC transporter ATP-binding protein [Planctomycetales bacterium]|nr:ABC transporter ATP-binding protein [Planctomycetales bacterium]MBN8628076.1 ABC transporter ATP-binding protein [Planctomycetota bacterium]